MTTLANCNRKISEIMVLLKTEIKQLRAGQLHNVAHLATQKNQIMKALEYLIHTYSNETHHNTAPASLTRHLKQLKALSQESSLLLQAASKGIKDAQNRIFKLQNQQTQVGVYGRKGGAISYFEDPATHEKKI